MVKDFKEKKNVKILFILKIFEKNSLLLNQCAESLNALMIHVECFSLVEIA